MSATRRSLVTENLVPTDEERARFRTLVLDALRPDQDNHQAIPMEAFKATFAFIAEEQIRDHLAEAYYQARLANRLEEMLDLSGGFPHLFWKTQIVHYASLFEAIIDYYLNKCNAIFTRTELKKISPALASGIMLTKEDGTSLVIAEEKQVHEQLRHVRFENRLTKAISLGIVENHHRAIILATYNARNKIHLLEAASKEYKPTRKAVAAAYTTLWEFIKHVQRWSKRQVKQ